MKKIYGKHYSNQAAIELVMDIKTDFRMGQDYLHGNNSSQINAFLAATG